MSVKWITAVYAHRGLDLVTKAVLLAIADSASDHGHCYPSISHLAEKTGGHRATIIRAIEKLEAWGYIRADRSNGRQTQYWLTEPENWSQRATGSDAEPVAESNRSRTATGRTEQHNRSHRATGPVAESDTNRHKPSRTVRMDERAREVEPVDCELISSGAADLADLCSRKAGIANVAPASINRNIDIVNGWLKAGCDPGLDIIPTIDRLTSTSREAIHSLRYFDKEVRHAHAKRTASASTGGRERAGTARADQKPSRLETAAAAADRASAILRERKAARGA